MGWKVRYKTILDHLKFVSCQFGLKIETSVFLLSIDLYSLV